MGLLGKARAFQGKSSAETKEEGLEEPAGEDQTLDSKEVPEFSIHSWSIPPRDCLPVHRAGEGSAWFLDLG